jgi:hypothetical protein
MTYQNYYSIQGENSWSELYIGPLTGIIYSNNYRWERKPNTKFVYIEVMGAGAGGGGGASQNSGVVAAGGGGGGGGAKGCHAFFSPFIPNFLTINLVGGGRGGSGQVNGGGPGGAGSAPADTSYILFYQGGYNDILSTFYNSASSAGSPGSTTAGTAGGGSSDFGILKPGPHSYYQAGFPSNGATDPTSTSHVVSLFSSATTRLSSYGQAAGGGGCNAAGLAGPGGSIDFSSPSSQLYPNVTGGYLTGGSGGFFGGGNGSNGLGFGSNLYTTLHGCSQAYSPFIFTAGAGGGACSGFGYNGGNGGHGGPGCGGGGGGGTIGGTGTTGGRGGNGGPAYCLIISYF